MATLQEENDLRNKLKEILAKLAGMNASDLARRNELGPGLNFESGVVFFSRALRLFHTLNESSLDDISFQRMSVIRDQANNYLQLFQNIKDFDLTKFPNNPIAVRDQFINQARDWYDALFEQLAPTVAFTIRKGTDFERLEEQAKDTLRRVDAMAKEHEDALRTSRKDAQELVDEVRRIASESGVSQHAIHFKQEADQHETSAKSWLTATIWLAFATVVVGAILAAVWFLFGANLTATQSVQIIVSKVVIFSVMLSATLWAGRTYRAHRHNAVVNRHRQNALTTFQAFAKAAGDEQTKNAVLLQATQCIFSPQQTGYIQGEPESAGVPQVLEIIRDLGKAK